VPEEQRNAIFDIEVSSKSHPAGLARGYGLTLVRRVAERLGGEARVEDSPLGGARFVARLPVVASPAVAGAVAGTTLADGTVVDGTVRA
jgi:two-component system CitB family sensor kinase